MNDAQIKQEWVNKYQGDYRLTHEDKEHLIGLILKEMHYLHTINAGVPMGQQMIDKIERLEALKRKLQQS